MKKIHEMKERIAHELECLCEDYLCGDLKDKHYLSLKLAAKTFNELHEACETMCHMHAHIDKGIMEHLKK